MMVEIRLVQPHFKRDHSPPTCGAIGDAYILLLGGTVYFVMNPLVYGMLNQPLAVRAAVIIMLLFPISFALGIFMPWMRLWRGGLKLPDIGNGDSHSLS